MLISCSFVGVSVLSAAVAASAQSYQWTPATIAAFTAALIAIIGAIASGIVTVITASKASVKADTAHEIAAKSMDNYAANRERIGRIEQTLNGTHAMTEKPAADIPGLPTGDHS